ncbi:hypothetical protein ACQP3L_39360, partial [Escherichia coli]
ITQRNSQKTKQQQQQQRVNFVYNKPWLFSCLFVLFLFFKIGFLCVSPGWPGTCFLDLEL